PLPKNGNHHGVGPESEAKRHKLLNNSRRCQLRTASPPGQFVRFLPNGLTSRHNSRKSRAATAAAAAKKFQKTKRSHRRCSVPTARRSRSRRPQQQAATAESRQVQPQEFAPNIRLNQAAGPAPPSAAAKSSAEAFLDQLKPEKAPSSPMTLEESIASDWESLTDWGEGHLPEKATPQFLAMVEKVKSGYQARIDGLQQVVDRLTGRCAQAEVDRDELARLRRQVEELRSPDVRRLRAKYDAQKEELQRLRAAVQGYGDGDVNGCSNGDGKLGNGQRRSGDRGGGGRRGAAGAGAALWEKAGF
uniref:ING domain-containing protein n=1 Tax=Macrostomum lignano TaxID=282301 RepID=A0A1I8FAI0_9PLAT